jgi:hypothetical protein
MSRKSQLFPQSSADETPWRVAIQRSWKSAPSNSREMKLLRSWLVYDSTVDRGFNSGRFNWRLILGVAIVVTVSASFWAGVGLLVAQIWK